ncbi:Hypothetical protein A7982_05996 [Minicystis rosea]|nr:Hypothetical protein A7982_05996 [Minicystis rosea]
MTILLRPRHELGHPHDTCLSGRVPSTDGSVQRRARRTLFRFRILHWPLVGTWMIHRCGATTPAKYLRFEPDSSRDRSARNHGATERTDATTTLSAVTSRLCAAGPDGQWACSAQTRTSCGRR